MHDYYFFLTNSISDGWSASCKISWYTFCNWSDRKIIWLPKQLSKQISKQILKAIFKANFKANFKATLKPILKQILNQGI